MADLNFSPGVGSISPPLDLSTDLKPIDPLAREKIDAATNASFSGFADAPANFDQFQDAPDAFAAFPDADDLDVRSPEELNADRTNFNPVTYFQTNPDVANNPAKLSKLLAVYRKRREEGLDAGEVVKSAIKETPGLIANIAGGVKRLGERALDVTVQPISNVVLGTLTGDLFDEQRRNALFNETRRVIKKGVAEVSAGTESAAVGLVDLSRQGLRKLPKLGSEFEPIPLPTKTTDQDLLREISDDVAFRQNAAEILTGQGEAAKNFGLDKETLAKQGIELDEKAIEQLSLVDPITMVATGGAFKLVGIGGKILGTAKTLEGAKLIAEKLANVAKFSAGKTVQGVGKVVGGTGTLLKGTGTGAATIAGISSAVSGGGIPQALIVGAAAKTIGPALRKLGPALEHAGKAIAGEVPVSAALQKVVDYAAIPGRAATEAGKGAFTGIVAAAPFAVMADEDATAGALFGAGAALGAGTGTAAHGFRVVKQGASRRYFGENRPVLPDVASPGYGTDAALDKTHSENVSNLSAQDAAELNNFREGVRNLGGEIYAVDRATFRRKLFEAFPDATPEQLDIYENHSAFFDQNLGDRKVVYLNSDTTGLQHDAGHIFDALLSPEKRTELRTAVEEAFTPAQRKEFRDTYERRVGSKISDKAAVDEFIAEQFAALFNNVPITELNAPKSLLNKFIDVAAEGAEALGIDLSAGATTPNLGAPVAVGIRQLFRNAAGEVTRRNVETAAPTPPAPRPAPDVNVPADFFSTFPAAPVAPAAPVTPPAPSPVAPSAPAAPVAPAPVAPNIRVTPEQTAAFTRTPPLATTPEARAAAAARSAETGVDYARAEAKKADGTPTSLIIEQISDTMESGRPVVSIEHLGITSASTPAAPLGRTPRRGEQAAGYAALEAAQLDVRQNAPPEIVTQHSKNFVPVRWTDQGGTPTLIAMSLDKVISNILKISADPKAKDLIPYPTEGGKLTPAGWREVVADAQAYSENQANGRKGDGGRLTVPEAGLSIPAENPTYTPKPLTPERANFQNLVQGIAPPQTSRAQAGVMPGNVKGQLLAEANQRAVEIPANIPTKQAGKQAFAEFPPRVVQEVNPLRNAMEARGVKTRELLEVTERIRAKDIVSATPRPDVAYQAPVTDIIRGGFLPAPEEFRTKNLAGQSVEQFGQKILTGTPEQWKAETDAMAGGLTGGAWNLGLGLTNAADVAVLRSLADQASVASKAAMKAGDMDAAFPLVTKGQFFREAYEAATGTGSAGAAFKRGTAGFGEAKPPFPVEQRITPPEETPKFLPKPSEELNKLAKSYADDAGIPYSPKGDYAEVRPEVAKKLADFYDKAVSDPTNPEVAASYDALIRETEEQGKAILAAGYKIEPWTGAGEPYKNSAEAVADVRENKHLFFRKTEDSFGAGESNVGNPMLRESTLVPGQVANDVFRWVHDFFGHAKGDFQFGPRGEFNAWRAHSEMYSPEAQGALAGETLAQNSWVNYGPHLEGKNIPLAERPFAEQKNVVVPPELIAEATFLPRTESGRKLEERGFEIVPTGEMGIRGVKIFNILGEEVASISSVQRSAKNAEISLVTKVKGAPKGLGEVLYREVGAQLKDDGVTKVTGQVIAPEPLAIRKKVFGDFASIDINGEPATFEQALATSERLKSGFENEMASIEPVSEITADMSFLPEEQQDMNFIRQGDSAVKVNGIERERRRIISELKTVQPKDEAALIARLAQVNRDAEIAWRDHTRSRAGFLPEGKVKLLEGDEKASLFPEDAGFGNYWLSPEGKFFRTGGNHQDWAKARLSDPVKRGSDAEQIFKNNGWIRLSVERETSNQAVFVDGNTATPKQSGALKAWSADMDGVEIVDVRNLVFKRPAFAPGNRDAQGRPLDKKGEIDYVKWQKESVSANRKRTAEPIEAAPEPTGPITSDTEVATGWITPDKKFVPLDAAFHEQYLANNAEALNKKFGTNFSETSSPDDRLAALNAGFVRFRNQGGRLSIEANAKQWSSLKSKVLQTLQDREGKFDSLTLSLLNDEGQQVDSTSAPRLHEMSVPDKMNALEEAVSSVRGSGPRFLPEGEVGLPGFEEVSAEQAGRLKAKRRISAVKKNNPEAVSPQYARDEAGEIIVTADGNPKPLTLDYDFINSPVGKEASKGLKGAAREEATANALGDRLTALHRSVEDRPDIKAGAKWYSTARTRLRKVFGNDSKLFAELLGATSARTPVETNYRFALDAYNQFKAGAFDTTLAKYREGKKAWETGDIKEFLDETKAEEPTRGQFIDWWVKKHDLGVTQASGKKYGMNSRAVLRVLDGSWAAEVQGPKTPNFAGNLTGETFEATIDVWAARLLHRLANEGKKDRWRILPENETGVTDADFYLGQAAYRNAAKQLGIKPDALQAILWFAEKDHWEQKGWTRGAGAAKSDFNVLLAETERTPEGTLQMKSAQIGLDLGASIGDIVKKKKK